MEYFAHDFILANSVDPGETLPFATFYLGLHYLPKYLFTSIKNQPRVISCHFARVNRPSILVAIAHYFLYGMGCWSKLSNYVCHWTLDSTQQTVAALTRWAAASYLCLYCLLMSQFGGLYCIKGSTLQETFACLQV